MALGTGLYGTGGTHDNYTPEIWSKRIQVAFEENTIAREDSLTLTELISSIGGDVIHVPKLAQRTAGTRALSSFDEISPTAATEGEFTMNVQTWVVDDEFVSDSLKAQTKIFMMSQIDQQMQKSIARKFDTDIFAEYTNLTPTPPVADDGTSILLLDNIADGHEALDDNSVPSGSRVLNLNQRTFWRLWKDNVITSTDFADNKGKQTGKIAMIAGTPVKKSLNLPTGAGGSGVNILRHSEAFAYAVAKPASVLNEHYAARRGTIVGADMLYGVGTYRPEAGVVLYSA